MDIVTLATRPRSEDDIVPTVGDLAVVIGGSSAGESTGGDVC
jgi:hypothetical protein